MWLSSIAFTIYSLIFYAPPCFLTTLLCLFSSGWLVSVLVLFLSIDLGLFFPANDVVLGSSGSFIPFLIYFNYWLWVWLWVIFAGSSFEKAKCNFGCYFLMVRAKSIAWSTVSHPMMWPLSPFLLFIMLIWWSLNHSCISVITLGSTDCTHKYLETSLSLPHSCLCISCSLSSCTYLTSCDCCFLAWCFLNGVMSIMYSL